MCGEKVVLNCQHIKEFLHTHLLMSAALLLQVKLYIKEGTFLTNVVKYGNSTIWPLLSGGAVRPFHLAHMVNVVRSVIKHFVFESMQCLCLF